MESKKLIVTASPHITNHTSTRGLMLNVCIALLPALVASTLIFGARARALLWRPVWASKRCTAS